PVQPGAEARLLGVEALGVPPHAREDLLHELLGLAAVAEGAHGEAVKLGAVGAVEGSHRVLRLVCLERLEHGGRHLLRACTRGVDGWFGGPRNKCDASMPVATIARGPCGIV